MWYEEFDFYDDPLSTKPEDSYPTLVGVDEVVNELSYRLEAGSMVFVEGPDGSGKSSILYRLIDLFKGRKKVIFFDCSQIDKKLNIERLMKSRYGIVGRTLNIIPDNMILLLDNVPELSKRNSERIKYYFDQNYIKSVVLTGKSYAASSLPKSIKDRIGSRVVKLMPLSEEQAVDAVRQRLKEVEFIPDSIITKTFKLCNKGFKETLESLSKMCELASKAGEAAVSEKDLKAVMGDRNA